MNATYFRHAEFVRMLLENGARVNAETKSGLSALVYAAYNNDPMLSQLLLEHGANVEIMFEMYSDTFSLLGWAIERCNADVVALLLRFGGANNKYGGGSYCIWTYHQCAVLRLSAKQCGDCAASAGSE
jgi:ankyrin repeat protein